MKAEQAMPKDGDVSERASDGVRAIRFDHPWGPYTDEAGVKHTTTYIMWMGNGVTFYNTLDKLEGDDWQPLHPAADHAAEVKRLTAERDHWKANHDNQVRLKQNANELIQDFLNERDEVEEEVQREFDAEKAALTARVAELEADAKRLAVLFSAFRHALRRDESDAMHAIAKEAEVIEIRLVSPLPTAGDDACEVNPIVSRMCERGTKCCTVEHAPAEPDCPAEGQEEIEAFILEEFTPTSEDNGKLVWNERAKGGWLVPHRYRHVDDSSYRFPPYYRLRVGALTLDELIEREIKQAREQAGKKHADRVAANILYGPKGPPKAQTHSGPDSPAESVVCPRCHGSGKAFMGLPGSAPECRYCAGIGRVNKEPDSAAEERDTKRGFDYCMSCGGDLDTGWECNSCGLDWMPWVQFRPDAVDRPTKLRDESWLREAADAEDQHASVCAGDMAPRKPACLDGVPAVLCEYQHESWQRSFGIQYWVYGPIFDGKVAGVRGDSYLGEGLQGVYVSELTPIHHDPTDAAAVELRGRIAEGGKDG